ncbi:MAG: FtsQ-type POTRA domain-containing protein [Nitrospirae bacterium]|nr:FtsQ-type POTRA domain-containing protein [Nitrospirota bacterium]
MDDVSNYYRKKKTSASGVEWRGRIFKLLRLAITFGIICAVSFLMAAGYQFLAADEYFIIKDVRFIGNNFTTDEELRSLMELPADTNIFRVKIGLLQERIISHPWIRDAVIKRELPNSLVINIEERIPVAVALYKSRYYLIDKYGVALGRRESLQGDRHFPVVAGADFRGVRFGEERPADELIEALGVLDALKAKREFAGVENIIVDIEKGRLALRLDDYEINMGRGDYDKKLTRYVEVRHDMLDRGIASKKMDMRFLNKVVIKN